MTENMGLQKVERILVGLDREGRAKEALQAAAHLAQKLGGEVQPVHAVQIPVIAAEDLTLQGWQVSREELATEAQEALRTSYGPTLEAVKPVRVDLGNAAQVLLSSVDARGADVLFLGPHRHRPVLDFGNTARAVLAKATVPVWVQRGAWAAPRRLLVPIDLSEGTRAVLGSATFMARMLGAPMKVVYYFDAPDLMRAGARPSHQDASFVEKVWSYERALFDRLIAESDFSDVPMEASFEKGNPEESILQAHQKEDLIVMGTHGRTGLWRVLLGNVAYQVLRGATCPVLVIPTVTD